MLKLLQLLLYGHQHKWKIIKQVGMGYDEKIITRQRFYLQCEVCGNIKQVG